MTFEDSSSFVCYSQFSRTANSYQHIRGALYHSTERLALVHSEDGDTILLRKVVNYQSTRCNIREDFIFLSTAVETSHLASVTFTPVSNDISLSYGKECAWSNSRDIHVTAACGVSVVVSRAFNNVMCNKHHYQCDKLN